MTTATRSMEELTLEAQNLRLIGHNSINGRGRMGEGIAIHQQGSQRYAYLAHESGEIGLSILDVTNPRDPGLVNQIAAENGHVRFNSLSLSGETLVVARQTQQVGQQPAGMTTYDITQPDRPREVSFFDTSGPYSRGCHFVWFVDGRYAHLSTGMPDFQPSNEKDDQIYVIVDMADPQRPREVSRWWIPGMQHGDRPLPRHPRFDAGHRMHNSNVLPSRPGRAYLGWLDSGMTILDISDIQRPSLISQWNPAPPMQGFTHTVSPILSRELAIVSEESVRNNAEDWPKLSWIVDISAEANPVPLGSVPLPDPKLYAQRGGRYGSHNLYEDHEQTTCASLKNTTVGAYFNGGVRVHDLRNPLRAEEIGYFCPTKPENSNLGAAQINDVFVDETGLIYAIERISGGLYILEYTGPVPLD